MIDLRFEPGGAVLTLSSEPVNALSEAFLTEFHEALDRLAERRDLAVLHIRSSLKAFSAGGDLKQLAEVLGQPDAMVEYVSKIHRLFDRLEALPLVTLAEIGGPAVGGGYELALACDLRIAANEISIGLPEAQLGLFPGAGGTQRLTRLCGPGIASRVILAADMLSGAEACRLGLVQWAVPAAELASTAAAFRRRIAGLAPLALRVSKQCIAAWSDASIDGFALELECQKPIITSRDAHERVSAFLETRTSRKE